MKQQVAAGVLAERQIERDAVERGLARQLCGFVIGRRAGRLVAGFRRGASDNHSVQTVVIDDQKPRRAICASRGQPFSIQSGRIRLFKHLMLLAMPVQARFRVVVRRRKI